MQTIAESGTSRDSEHDLCAFCTHYQAQVTSGFDLDKLACIVGIDTIADFA
jgi:hypothetical protein